MQLSDLKVGEKAYIIKVSGYGGFRKRIVEMGFIKGKMVEVLQNAPLLDPIKYRIMGYEVSVRRSVAAQIDVLPVEEAKHIAENQANSAYFGTISEDDIRQVALQKRKTISVALVGNPNCGKTTIFNSASGQHARVGNYSGVTVDARKGEYFYKDYKFVLTDLPGTYSISAYSPEERFVREHIVKEKPDVILNVVDATNLERNLYLTTQLIDMNMRTVIALNFFDELENRGDKIDYEVLGKLIGIPIIPTVGTKNTGINQLFDTVIRLYEGSEIIDKEGKLLETLENDELIEKYHHIIELEHKHSKNGKNADLQGINHIHEIVRHIHINYGKTIETSIAKIKSVFSENIGADDDYTPRYIAIQLLEHDKEIEGLAAKFANYGEVCRVREKAEFFIEQDLKITASNAILDAKYGFIAGALAETFFPAKRKFGKTITAKIDKIVTNRYLAYPIFFAVLFLIFEATFFLGKYPMDWIDFLVKKTGVLVQILLSDGIFKDMLVDGIISGVGSVLVFLPNILILYFCMTLLDTSGYMARAAFIMDKLMHKIGLHGRSFIPLMMGFGCNVPAIMATRTIENRNSRMITIMISSLISCSARLPIFILFVGAFFPKHEGIALFGIYLTGILLAAILAKIFKKFIFHREETPFVMELPSYRVPTVKHLARETWEKCAQYLKKIGTTILVGSIIIWALSYFPVNQHNNAYEQQANSYLAKIGKAIEPALKPLGFDWKISVSLLTGVAAKEVVISTLGVLYNVQDDGNQAEMDKKLSAKLQAEVRSDGTRVFTPAVAIAFMLFVLIYFPCIATIATIKQETNSWLWASFAALYTIILAWLIAFITYNIMCASLVQESLVALIILLCLIFIAKKLLKSFSARKKCGNCVGC
ncbi:MAG: ferrous iron transport protein B [Prevotellaceae bacterium]|jgi:ferrous iron transport protein B|nr:ferrous iron transport protein B [Prevotellaceae bacterium]